MAMKKPLLAALTASMSFQAASALAENYEVSLTRKGSNVIRTCDCASSRSATSRASVGAFPLFAGCSDPVFRYTDPARHAVNGLSEFSSPRRCAMPRRVACKGIE